MHTKFTEDMFDFTSTDDLPEDLASKVQYDALERARVYLDLLEAGQEAGYKEMTISQIMAVATRAGMKDLVRSTVRAHLNKLEKAGLITKPRRQSYALPSKR